MNSTFEVFFQKSQLWHSFSYEALLTWSDPWAALIGWTCSWCYWSVRHCWHERWLTRHWHHCLRIYGIHYHSYGAVLYKAVTDEKIRRRYKSQVSVTFWIQKKMKIFKEKNINSGILYIYIYIKKDGLTAEWRKTGEVTSRLFLSTLSRSWLLLEGAGVL